jgi:hypothetical protein
MNVRWTAYESAWSSRYFRSTGGWPMNGPLKLERPKSSEDGLLGAIS